MTDRDSVLNEQKLSKLLFNAFSFEIDYNPNTSLLYELINAGGLKNIPDPDRCMHLTAWESRIQNIHRQKQALGEQCERVIEIFTKEHGSICTNWDDSEITVLEMIMQKSPKYVRNLPVI